MPCLPNARRTASTRRPIGLRALVLLVAVLGFSLQEGRASACEPEPHASLEGASASLEGASIARTGSLGSAEDPFGHVGSAHPVALEARNAPLEVLDLPEEELELPEEELELPKEEDDEQSAGNRQRGLRSDRPTGAWCRLPTGTDDPSIELVRSGLDVRGPPTA